MPAGPAEYQDPWYADFRAMYEVEHDWATGNHKLPGAVQLNGSTLPHTQRTINVRGSGKQAVDFSGITHFFVTPTIDIRSFGAVSFSEPQWAAQDSTTRANNRAKNTTALQDAANLGFSGSDTRKVIIPGDFNDVYEFDATILLNSGSYFVTDHEEPIGARLHYYGAVNTHAFYPSAQFRSVVVMSGVRLEDKRGSAAATGTGNGFHLEHTGQHGFTNGSVFENCFVTGFYRNIYTYQNDMIRIRGGWQGPAHDYAIYFQSPLNFTYVDGVAFITVLSAAPNQAGLMMVTGGGPDSVVEITNSKCEGDVAAANGIVLNTPPSTLVNGFTFRGGAPGAAVMMNSVVKIMTANNDGVGSDVTLMRVGCRAGGATNLLEVVETGTGNQTYTIPAHPTQPCVIRHWDEGQRVLMPRSRPGGGAYAWTQAASGTTPGTVVPGPGAGTSPTITIDGDDQQGCLTVLTGTTPGAGQLCTVYFRVTWPNHIKGVVLTPANGAAAGLAANQRVYPGNQFDTAANSQINRKYFRIYTNSVALASATTYRWHYRVLP